MDVLKPWKQFAAFKIGSMAVTGIVYLCIGDNMSVYDWETGGVVTDSQGGDLTIFPCCLHVWWCCLMSHAGKGSEWISALSARVGVTLCATEVSTWTYSLPHDAERDDSSMLPTDLQLSCNSLKFLCGRWNFGADKSVFSQLDNFFLHVQDVSGQCFLPSSSQHYYVFSASLKCIL